MREQQGPGVSTTFNDDLTGRREERAEACAESGFRQGSFRPEGALPPPTVFSSLLIFQCSLSMGESFALLTCATDGEMTQLRIELSLCGPQIFPQDGPVWMPPHSPLSMHAGNDPKDTEPRLLFPPGCGFRMLFYFLFPVTLLKCSSAALDGD